MYIQCHVFLPFVFPVPAPEFSVFTSILGKGYHEILAG